LTKHTPTTTTATCCHEFSPINEESLEVDVPHQHNNMNMKKMTAVVVKKKRSRKQQHSKWLQGPQHSHMP